MEPIEGWRWWLSIVCGLQLAWSIAGLIANPDFSVGEQATAVQVLGVDFNGWHAIAGIAIFAPGVIAAFRDDLAVIYTWVAIPTMLGGLIGLVTDRPFGLWYFPNLTSDMVLHIASAAFFALLLVVRHRSLVSTGEELRVGEHG